MTKAVLRITGERAAAESGVATPVVATIYSAESTGHGDFSCCVSIPALLDRDRQIFGADAENAQEVAASFVRELLRDYRLSTTIPDFEAR
jgi:hypothetical protein